MSELIKVRTKKEPHKEIEVTPQEYTDLKRAGLLVDDKKKGS